MYIIRLNSTLKLISQLLYMITFIQKLIIVYINYHHNTSDLYA